MGHREGYFRVMSNMSKDWCMGMQGGKVSVWCESISKRPGELLLEDGLQPPVEDFARKSQTYRESKGTQFLCVSLEDHP